MQANCKLWGEFNGAEKIWDKMMKSLTCDETFVVGRLSGTLPKLLSTFFACHDRWAFFTQKFMIRCVTLRDGNGFSRYVFDLGCILGPYFEYIFKLV